MRTVLATFSLFVILHANAQVENPISRDSLDQIVFREGEEEDTIMVDYLNQLAYDYRRTYPDLSFLLTEKAEKIARNIGYMRGIGNSIHFRGKIYRIFSELDSAIALVLRARTILEELDDQNDVAETYNTLGNIYYSLTNFRGALAQYRKAKELYTTEERKSIALINIAIAYMQFYAEERDRINLDSSLYYHSQALEIRKRINDQRGIGASYANLGVLYIHLGDLNVAYDLLKLSSEIQSSRDDFDGLANVLANMGRVQLDKGNYELAEKHLKDAISHAEQVRSKGKKAYALQLLTRLEAERGNFKKAFDYKNEEYAIQDSISTDLKDSQINRVNTFQELQLRNKEIELRKKDQIIRNYLITILTIIILVVLLLFYLRIRQLNRKRKRHQLEMERELAHKNRELTSYTMGMVSKNTFLTELEGLSDTMLQSYKNTEFAKELKRIKSKINQNLNSEQDWQEFRLRFNDVHPRLYRYLEENHKLTSNDLKLCAFVRLNFDIKETANLLGISPDSVKTSRYRLRRKLKLDPGEDLLNFLVKAELEYNG